MSRTAEEWGEVAVSLPGWRWMPGMQTLPLPTPGLPDTDDPATAGCFLALLEGALRHPFTVDQYYGPVSVNGDGLSVAWGDGLWSVHLWGYPRGATSGSRHGRLIASSTSLGRACIAAAEALGRWPGGAA
jgi:hypothetical protein